MSATQTTVSFNLTAFTTLLITGIPCYVQQIGSLRPCCLDSQRGNWYHVQSNGSFINVVSTLMIADYYQSRENDGTLRLIRQGNIIQSTDSFYCCQLPDASLFVQTLCVTIGMPSCPFQHMCHVMHQCIKFSKITIH